MEAGVGAGSIAIELDYMPAQDYLRLQEAPAAGDLRECKELYFDARMIKTDEEVAILRRVGVLTERVIGEVLARNPGRA